MTDEIIREDTMIYRAASAESDNVSEIWGKKLETKVVDATEVESFVAEGWVTHPTHIGEQPKPKEKADSKPSGSADLAKQIAELNATIAKLEGDLKAAEELANAESKAKDEALAHIAETEKAKTTLSIKGKNEAVKPTS